MDCIFCKIVNHETDSKIIFEDDDFVVFPDIHPYAPYHVLIVSKEHIADFMGIENHEIWLKMRVLIRMLIKKEGLVGKGYRVTINGGGAQAIDHLHVHLMGKIGKEKGL